AGPANRTHPDRSPVDAQQLGPGTLSLLRLFAAIPASASTQHAGLDAAVLHLASRIVPLKREGAARDDTPGELLRALDVLFFGIIDDQPVIDERPDPLSFHANSQGEPLFVLRDAFEVLLDSPHAGRPLRVTVRVVHLDLVTLL